jgi:hypothetical protein
MQKILTGTDVFAIFFLIYKETSMIGKSKSTRQASASRWQCKTGAGRCSEWAQEIWLEPGEPG